MHNYTDLDNSMEKKDTEIEPNTGCDDCSDDSACDCKKNKKLQNAEKWKYTLITTAIFVIVVHPMTFRLVDRLLGKILCKVASKSGCPTMCGLLIHTVVFTLALRYVMDLKI
jgi:hypothetical protein